MEIRRLTFTFEHWRFTFAARDAIHFPHAGNVLRGALGTRLPASIFAPAAAAGPSGLADLPRPFVLRASHLDGRTIAPGEEFTIDVHWFDTNHDGFDDFTQAFESAAAAGLGPGRGGASLFGAARAEHAINFDHPEQASRIAVRFLTPTELKHEGAVALEPLFPILAARARDRVSTLRSVYGDGPLPLDFAAFGNRAALVHLTHLALRHDKAVRHSTRTGQTHSIGGFTGEAHYAGDLGEFLPLLRAAQWTGVGRHCVWGNGAIALDSC